MRQSNDELKPDMYTASEIQIEKHHSFIRSFNLLRTLFEALTLSHSVSLSIEVLRSIDFSQTKSYREHGHKSLQFSQKPPKNSS